MASSDTVAAAFLLLVAAGTLFAMVVCIIRTPLTIAQTMYFFGAFVLARVLWRAQLPRRLPVADDEGAVLICNHRSSVDPFFIQVCTFRPTHWMVAREYCEHFAFRSFLRTCQVIPVNRGGIDTAATKAAIRLAAQGGLVGMLPEGRINMSDQFMLPVRPGAVLVALKARVPIIPCYIHGAPYKRVAWSPLIMKAKVRLIVGRPIDLSAYYDRHDAPEVVRQLMLEATKEIARLAGHDEFLPELAGRRWKPSQEELDGQTKGRRRSKLGNVG